MKNYYKIAFFLITVFIVFSVLNSFNKSSNTVSDVNADLLIESGSENQTLEPIIQQFAKDNHVAIKLKYKGSVDTMLDLQNQTIPFDAVWPANTLWISLGDTNKKVKYTQSIMTSPVVFGIRKSKAQELGFIGKDVSVKDILTAIRNKKLQFIMTSASQSNSGASAYIGFIYALLGEPDIITKADLQNPQLKVQIRELLAGINRSSGSSGWLKELFLKGNYDAMVNYESLIIETNQELTKQGKEPLYVVYPTDGIVIADSPLGYVNQGNAKKEELFKKLQAYLLSDSVQKQILALGRRTGFGGVLSNVDPSIFNPAWGINKDKILSPIKMPQADVIREALSLYQTEFRKPSYTIYCLDFSGSMEGKGETQVKEAMSILLNQDTASKYLLQNASQDVIEVIAFDDSIIKKWKVVGNDTTKLNAVLSEIQALNTGGGTDIYSPSIQGLSELGAIDTSQYIPAVILMTDGQSNTGKNFQDFTAGWKALNKDIPVFSIAFGDASDDQLKQIADLTRGRVFDGRTNLVDAFKSAKGYNQ